MNDMAGEARAVIPIAVDTGTAYGRPAPTSRRELTEVGPGTPMGNLLRRYWHPIGLAGDATATPRKVRVLGEDLILFRDGQGRPGLVYPHCSHRGASLYYGKVEDRGIRCCYHGWVFDVQGHCMEQPCEPEGGPRAQLRASPGIRCASATAWSGPIWDRRRRSRCCPATNAWSNWRLASSSKPTITASAAAARPSSRATGCSTTRTWSTRSTSSCCTAPSAAPSSCRRWR